MKKMFLVILVLTSFYAFAEVILNDSFLIKNKFTSSSDVHGSKIEFIKGGKYNADYTGGGFFWYIEGKYTIKDSNVLLIPEVCKNTKDGDIISCDESMNKARCSIIEDNKSFTYSKSLSCESVSEKKNMGYHEDGISYDISSSRVNAGEQKIILEAYEYEEDGFTVKNKIDVKIPVIVMGQAKGVVKSNLKMRTLPSAESNHILYHKDSESAAENSIPKDATITVLARTVEKLKVGKLNNYWYYVEAGANTGWVFGEFVDVK